MAKMENALVGGDAQSDLSVFSAVPVVGRGLGLQRGRRIARGALGAAEVVRPRLHVRVRRRAAPGEGRALVRLTVSSFTWKF